MSRGRGAVFMAMTAGGGAGCGAARLASRSCGALCRARAVFWGATSAGLRRSASSCLEASAMVSLATLAPRATASADISARDSAGAGRLFCAAIGGGGAAGSCTTRRATLTASAAVRAVLMPASQGHRRRRGGGAGWLGGCWPASHAAVAGLTGAPSASSAALPAASSASRASRRGAWALSMRSASAMTASNRPAGASKPVALGAASSAARMCSSMRGGASKAGCARISAASGPAPAMKRSSAALMWRAPARCAGGGRRSATGFLPSRNRRRRWWRCRPRSCRQKSAAPRLRAAGRAG